MKREGFEKYIGELSPEMQEKARQCKTMEELNVLLAENDVELSEDALEAVAGGCSKSAEIYTTGDPITQEFQGLCPTCGKQLYYWDMCYQEKGCSCITRMYCSNPSCNSYNNGLWYACASYTGAIFEGKSIQKY